MTSKNRELLLLALVVAAAIAVRVYGLDWGLPYRFHSDEGHMIGNAEKIRSAASLVELPKHEPLFFIYPTFLNHLLLLFAVPLFRLFPFSPTDPASTTLYYLMGRGLSASFGVASCVLVYVIGRRAYSGAAGLLGAAFLAFSVLHIRESHFFTTDVTMTFFTLLLLWLAQRIAAGAGSARLWAGVGLVTGLGCATKQTVLMALPVVLLAHLVDAGRDGRNLGALRRAAAKRTFWTRPLLAAAIAAVAYMAANPYPLFAPDVFMSWMESLKGFLTGTDQRNWIFQFTGTTVAFWFTNLLWFGMGPPLLLAALAGAGWALWRRRTGDVLVLTYLGFYLATVGTGFMKFVRYAIPLIPLFSLLAARLLVELQERLQGRSRTAARALAAAVLVVTALLGVSYLNIYRVGDPRVQASRWIHENIPAGTTVAVDNSRTTPPLGTIFTQPDFNENYVLCLGDDECVKENHYVIKVIMFRNYATHKLNPPERFREYIAERLAGAEWLIMGEEFSEQYRKRPDAYPAVVQFYQDLADGKTAFREERVFRARPSLFGFEWSDDRAELSFRMFDHPRIRIYRRIRADTGSHAGTLAG